MQNITSDPRMMYRDRKGNQIPLPQGVAPGERQSAYGICVKRGRVLLVQPTWSSLWEFPGGRIDGDETPIVTVQREFLEETGYVIDVIQESPVAQKQTKFYQDDVDRFFNSTMYFFFIQQLGTQDKSLIRRDEVARIRWYSIPKLDNSNMHETHLEILQQNLG